MQTHEDRAHRTEFLRRLKRRANDMVRDKQSEITAGKEGEEPLAEWKHAGISVRHMPDDEQGILRISIGGGSTSVPLNYCVFRGGVGSCIDLLEKAVAALKAAP